MPNEGSRRAPRIGGWMQRRAERKQLKRQRKIAGEPGRPTRIRAARGRASGEREPLAGVVNKPTVNQQASRN
jgi:hypothetical protein